jgi:hypothetical protein
MLPINGRDFRRLTILLPALLHGRSADRGSFTVNGQREKANIFLIDGVDNSDSFRNQPSLNQGGVTGLRRRCCRLTPSANSACKPKAKPVWP